MFFLSGFGSVIPYILYICIIWICVLFGYRIRFTEFFSTKPSEPAIAVTTARSFAAAQYHDISCEYRQDVNQHRTPDILKQYLIDVSNSIPAKHNIPHPPAFLIKPKVFLLPFFLRAPPAG
jgi:hypothetical protein